MIKLDWGSALCQFYLRLECPSMDKYVTDLSKEEEAQSYIHELAMVSLTWNVLNPVLMIFGIDHLRLLSFQTAILQEYDSS